MSSARFEELLKRTMGLNAASIGSSAIIRALDQRMAQCGLESHDAYWELLQRSRSEIDELIEAVVVPETWFFRDPQAFAAVVRFVTEQCGRIDPARPLRLLSLPCSTGEEPYTLAMALLEAGLPASRFSIDAVDISTQALARAQRGVYGRNSFRSRDLGFRDRHFEPIEGRHRIRDAVRTPVHFRQGNMLDANFLAGAECYDVIFCRNLLIYFDLATQVRALGVLKRLLAPAGMLCVGHSEASLMPSNGFASARIPMAFAFHRAAEPERPTAPARSAAIAAVTTSKASGPRTPPRRSLVLARTRHGRPASATPLRSEATPSLDELRRIADCGRLDEAARGCEAHMRECGPSSDTLLLLGLICDASGNAAEAISYYRKALYLEPAHSEALGHLALLLKQQGDHAGAQRLGERMRRRDERGGR